MLLEEDFSVICITRVLDAHLLRSKYYSRLCTCVALIISRDDIISWPRLDLLKSAKFNSTSGGIW